MLSTTSLICPIPNHTLNSHLLYISRIWFLYASTTEFSWRYFFPINIFMLCSAACLVLKKWRLIASFRILWDFQIDFSSSRHRHARRSSAHDILKWEIKYDENRNSWSVMIWRLRMRKTLCWREWKDFPFSNTIFSGIFELVTRSME